MPAEPIVSLQPKSLEFDSGGGCEEVVTLENKDRQMITFKFKTTNPDEYSVKPRLGFIQAGGTVRAVIQHRKIQKPGTSSEKAQRFQVEYRFLEDSEQQSYASEVPDPSRMDKEAAALAARLWKPPFGGAVGKIILPVTLRADGAPESGRLVTARGDRGPALRAAARGDSGDSELSRKLKEKQDEYNNAFLHTQEHNAKLQELRAKSEGGCAISGLFAVIICLLCVYLGIYLDKYYAEGVDVTGVGGGEL